MGSISLSIPQTGQPVSTEDPKIASDFTILQNVINGNLDDSNITPSGITDARLASPQGTVYREILTSKAILQGLTGAQVTMMGTRAVGAGRSLASGAGVDVSSTEGEPLPDLIAIAAADFAVPGKTTRLRLRGVLLTNNVAPLATFTVGLYPFSTGTGAANNLIVTYGAAVQTVSFVSPGANSIADQKVQSALPADFYYGLGLAQSGTLAAGAVVAAVAQLSIVHT